MKKHVNGTTQLWPMFSSESILVRREEEAYPFSSLLADCGGTLGLFIGFNFMMMWGWMLDFSFFSLVVLRRTINRK